MALTKAYNYETKQQVSTLSFTLLTAYAAAGAPGVFGEELAEEAVGVPFVFGPDDLLQSSARRQLPELLAPTPTQYARAPITDPGRLLSPTKISNPWMEGTSITSLPAPKGTTIDMAMAPGQTSPGGFGTPNGIPSLDYARNQLAITPGFKPEIEFVQRYAVPEGTMIQYGTVGPQTYNGVTYPGGAPQIQILNYADRANLVPIGKPTKLP
jgi:hypothetical protein